MTEDGFALMELGHVAHRVAETGGAGLRDARLVRVWDQLMLRDRKTDRFLHPTLCDVGYGTAEQRQQFAIGKLLTAACECPPPAMQRRERDALREDLRILAATLRTTVDRLQRLGLRPLHNVADWPRVDPLIVAADDAEAAANDVERKVLLIDRDRGMQFERALAVWLARMSQRLFGKVLPGVVATLVEVVSGHPIEARRVRDWLKGAHEE